MYIRHTRRGTPCSTGEPRGVKTPSSRRVYSASPFRVRSLGSDLDSSGVDPKLLDFSTSATGSRPEGGGLSSARARRGQFAQWGVDLTPAGLTIQTPVLCLPILWRPVTRAWSQRLLAANGRPDCISNPLLAGHRVSGLLESMVGRARSLALFCLLFLRRLVTLSTSSGGGLFRPVFPLVFPHPFQKVRVLGCPRVRRLGTTLKLERKSPSLVKDERPETRR
jgi:hypothetical protein